MASYPWPGNVRELENVIQRAVVSSEGRIEPEHLPARLREGASVATTAPQSSPASRGLAVESEDLNLERLERRVIERALQRTGGNLVEAGRLLGMSRATLYRKLKTYKLRETRAPRSETTLSS
jgi:DNA-binding NtrC family response regulator